MKCVFLKHSGSTRLKKNSKCFKYNEKTLYSRYAALINQLSTKFPHWNYISYSIPLINNKTNNLVLLKNLLIFKKILIYLKILLYPKLKS